MDYTVLQVEPHDDGVVLLQLNRPDARNALSIRLRDEVSHAVESLGSARALVITGAGPTFCAGFDLTEFTAAADDPDLTTVLWASSDRFHHALLRCPVPVIAALNGPALAGGFDLATLCDLRIAAPGTWFARPEVEWATPLYRPLRDIVGAGLARELCLTARRVELDEAVRVGLVNAVSDDPVATALEWAAQIAKRPADAVRATKAKFIDAAGIAARETLAL